MNTFRALKLELTMHFFTHYGYFLLLFTFLTLGSCSAPKDDEEEIIVDIEPEFVVDIYEARDPLAGRPAFGLWIESIADYPCSGFEPTVSVEQNGTAVDFYLTGVQAPGVCDSLQSPIRAFAPIGELANGVYALNFHLGQAIDNRGSLLVQNGRYEWTLPETAGIDVRNRVLDRIPSGMIWGYARTPNEQVEPVANQFISDLKTLSAEHQLPPGYYGYFTVAGTGLPFAHQSMEPAGNYRLFVRRATGDRESIRQLINQYRNAVQQPLEIRCWSSEGEF